MGAETRATVDERTGEYRYFIGQHSADRAVEGVLDVSHLRK